MNEARQVPGPVEPPPPPTPRLPITPCLLLLHQLCALQYKPQDFWPSEAQDGLKKSCNNCENSPEKAAWREAAPKGQTQTSACRGAFESINSSAIAAWRSNTTMGAWKSLQGVVSAAEMIISSDQPSMDNVYIFSAVGESCRASSGTNTLQPCFLFQWEREANSRQRRRVRISTNHGHHVTPLCIYHYFIQTWGNLQEFPCTCGKKAFLPSNFYLHQWFPLLSWCAPSIYSGNFLTMKGN